MEYTDEIRQMNEQFNDLLYNDALLSKIMFGILCIACLYLFFTALYKMMKRHWDSTYYLLLCVSVFIWSIASLLSTFIETNEYSVLLETLQYTGIIPIPALLLLHIRKQVSYKETGLHYTVIISAVPVFLIVLLFRDLIAPGSIGFLPAIHETQWYYVVFYLYTGITVCMAFVRCFDVLFQMPLRTRRSTRFTLVSVSSVALLFLIDALWNNTLSEMIPQNDITDLLLPLGAPIAAVFILYPLYNALFIMPASDVIVTSREFVMKGLNTTVLVMNNRKQILDWNKKDWNNEYPLPKPLYAEPFEIYRNRIMEQRVSRVSQYNEDILTINHNGTETHFFLHMHEAGNNKRRFGYVAEISEVTPIYTILRYVEEIAYFDTLTGLNNRNSYIEYIDKIVKEENMPLLIIVGDLNKLKIINDIHGHLLGDELIKTVSDIISETKQNNAFTARVGGDEFVLLIPNGSTQIADDFIKSTNARCGQIKHEIFSSPSISWGYSLMKSVDQSYNDAFAEADAMMYKYKKERIEFSSSGMLPEN